jgi:hypothetical protein
MEIYTPSGTALSSWPPTVTSLSATTLAKGSTYSVSGTQLAAAAPVPATATTTRTTPITPWCASPTTARAVVTYARTSSMTSHSIKAGAASSTNFTVAPATPTGPSALVVVANGIASAPQAVTIS